MQQPIRTTPHHHHRRWWSLTAAAVLGITTLGASPAAADPTDTPAPAPSLAPADSAIGTGDVPPAVRRLVARLRQAGAVAVDIEGREGSDVWSLTSGRSQLDPNRPAEAGAHFRAGSVTKQMVAVLALQLVEDGTWTLETTLGEVAPGLWPGQESITVRELLSHTSALPEYLIPLISQASSSAAFLEAISHRRTDADLIAVARELPVTAQRGQFSYSNTNYVVLGQMLRLQTGTALPRLVKREVLRPAGMEDSFFAENRVLPAPRLREYAKFPGERVDLRTFHPSMFSAAGSLVTTTSDLNDFHTALESGELIPRRLVRTMQREVAPGTGYGLASYVVPQQCGKHQVNGHDGATWGTLTLSFAAGPRRTVSVAMTGRSYAVSRFTTQVTLLQKLVGGAFTAMCPAEPSGRLRTTPAWPSADLSHAAGIGSQVSAN